MSTKRKVSEIRKPTSWKVKLESRGSPGGKSSKLPSFKITDYQTDLPGCSELELFKKFKMCLGSIY